MYAALPGSTARLMPTSPARIGSSASVSVSMQTSSAVRKRSTQLSSCAIVSTFSYAPFAANSGAGVGRRDGLADTDGEASLHAAAALPSCFSDPAIQPQVGYTARTPTVKRGVGDE